MINHRALSIGDSGGCEGVYLPIVECGGGCADFAQHIINLQNDVDSLDYRLDSVESLTSGKSNVVIQETDQEGTTKTVTLIGSVS